MSLNKLFEISPYSLNKKSKAEIITPIIKELSIYHQNNCEEYKRFINAIDFNLNNIRHYRDVPFIPVNLFKDFDLKSIKEDKIFKTLTSSGTTSQKVSRIFLDRETSQNQTKVLTKLVNSYLGKTRLPMIIVDNKNVLKNRNMFSARGAGILGFSLFGKDKIFLLDTEMKIDSENFVKFIKENKDKKIFMFGFTFMIWTHLLEELKKNNKKYDLNNVILFHGGGWKKLAEKEITNKDFKNSLKQYLNIDKIYDYYGMVEQTGAVYFECDYGYMHASNYSDILIRDSMDFSELSFGEKGLVQLISVLPKSYPGHSILTEDEGVLIGEDDCKCGKMGKYFKILGRIADSELRGCSDTYAEEFRKS